MTFTLKEFEDYNHNAPYYADGLVFVQSGLEDEDVICEVQWLRRLCDKKHGVSFMLVTSTTDSKGAHKQVRRTGKRGRPKIKTVGEKVARHVHGLIVNDSEENDIDEIKTDLQTYSRKRRKKRKNLKQQKIKSLQGGMYIVGYMKEQADETYRGGGFDFDYFDHPLYAHITDDDLEKDDF